VKPFALSWSTLQEINDTFDATGEDYKSVRSGNTNKKKTRIPQTASLRTKVEAFLRDKQVSKNISK
jgi:hypothetical protein